MATSAEQIERLLEGLVSGGYAIVNEFDSGARPVTIAVANADGVREFRVFCWNITPGGQGRSPDERRVQTTRPNDAPFLIPDDLQTLVLGYDEDHDLFAAWDVEKHPNPSSSASLQIPLGRATLEEGAATGFAARERQLEEGVVEVVVVFRPELVADYLDLLPAFSVSDPGEGIATAAAGRGEERPLEELPGDIHRRRAISEVSRAVRDARFRSGVLRAYGFQCAFCGLGAGLTHAAHIRSVQAGGADQIRNGLAACPTHHAAFDLGILIVEDDFSIRLNDQRLDAVRATEDDRDGLQGALLPRLRLPEQEELRPAVDNLQAHRRRWLGE